MVLTAVAFHIEQRIDIDQTCKAYKEVPVKRDRYFALYHLSENRFIYLKDYGSIVFLNCDKKFIKEFFVSHFGQKPAEQNFQETFEVEVNQEVEESVMFSKVVVNELTDDNVHIILLNLAQSVALSNYQKQAEDILSSSSVISQNLSTKGKIFIGRKQLRMLIGKAMVLKSKIAENLYIFDSPDLANDKEELSIMDEALTNSLDILNRHESLQHNLTTITENLEFLMDILQHKYSSLLEWIIILLILFEVVQVLLEKFV